MRMFQEFFHVEVNYGKRAHSADLQFFLTWMCVCRFKQIVQVVIYGFQCSEMRLDIFLLWRSPVLAPCFITWASPRDSRPSKNKPAHLSYEWMSMCGSVSRVGGFIVLCCSHLPQNFHMATMPLLQSTLKYTRTRLTATFKVLPGKIKETDK